MLLRLFQTLEASAWPGRIVLAVLALAFCAALWVGAYRSAALLVAWGLLFYGGVVLGGLCGRFVAGRLLRLSDDLIQRSAAAGSALGFLGLPPLAALIARDVFSARIDVDHLSFDFGWAVFGAAVFFFLPPSRPDE